MPLKPDIEKMREVFYEHAAHTGEFKLYVFGTRAKNLHDLTHTPHRFSVHVAGITE